MMPFFSWDFQKSSLLKAQVLSFELDGETPIDYSDPESAEMVKTADGYYVDKSRSNAISKNREESPFVIFHSITEVTCVFLSMGGLYIVLVGILLGGNVSFRTRGLKAYTNEDLVDVEKRVNALIWSQKQIRGVFNKDLWELTEKEPKGLGVTSVSLDASTSGVNKLNKMMRGALNPATMLQEKLAGFNMRLTKRNNLWIDKRGIKCPKKSDLYEDKTGREYVVYDPKLRPAVSIPKKKAHKPISRGSDRPDTAESTKASDTANAATDEKDTEAANQDTTDFAEAAIHHRSPEGHAIGTHLESCHVTVLDVLNTVRKTGRFVALYVGLAFSLFAVTIIQRHLSFYHILRSIFGFLAPFPLLGIVSALGTAYTANMLNLLEKQNVIGFLTLVFWQVGCGILYFAASVNYDPLLGTYVGERSLQYIDEVRPDREVILYAISGRSIKESKLTPYVSLSQATGSVDTAAELDPGLVPRVLNISEMATSLSLGSHRFTDLGYSRQMNFVSCLLYSWFFSMAFGALLEQFQLNRAALMQRWVLQCEWERSLLKWRWREEKRKTEKERSLLISQLSNSNDIQFDDDIARQSADLAPMKDTHSKSNFLSTRNESDVAPDSNVVLEVPLFPDRTHLVKSDLEKELQNLRD